MNNISYWIKAIAEFLIYCCISGGGIMLLLLIRFYIQHNKKEKDE